MLTLKKLVTTGSAAILLLFGIYVVSTPFLREPPTPQIQITIEPPTDETGSGPLTETGETGFEATSEPVPTTHEPPTGAYRTGERTGEQLNHLWKQTKDFGKGLWSSLTEKEN